MRVGLAGCGAVSRIYYAPALRELEGKGELRLTGAFDPDRDAATDIADQFEDAQALGSLDGLLAQRPDFIVIASPPQFHAGQAITALEQGIAVHCEKPLAISLGEGRRMVAAAERAGVPLSIGMVRRRLAPVRMIRSLLDRNAIGDLQSIDIFEGGPFHWPVASPVYFDRHQGAGGVFEDVGTHVLDLLHWCLGAPSEIAFADDAMGGVAANCVATLTYGEAIATIRLSRDWHRPNQWLLRGTSGWMRWSLDDWERVEFAAGDYEVRAEMLAPEDAVTFEQAFAAQLSDFARSLRNGASDFVRGAEALPVLETLERCAAVRTRMDMPWLA